MNADTNLDPLFLELGKALFVFQAIEARLKSLLPFLNIPGSEEPPKGEGWVGRRKYLDSKEMLGTLVKLLQERISSECPELLEQEWRTVVQGRNDVVHNFALQSFAKCETPQEQECSIDYVKSRRLRALPLLMTLDALLRGFVATLQLPPGFEGQVNVELPDWWHPGAA